MNEEKETEQKNVSEQPQKKGGMTLPNKLTISRVIMIPLFILFYYLHFPGHYFVSFGVFAVACFTDYFDGKIARKYGLVTNLGKFLDPIADKVLILSGMVVLLTNPKIFTENLGDWAMIVAGCGVVLILAREIIVSGFRMVAAGEGTVIAADIFGKYKTTVQDLAVGTLIVGAGVVEISKDIYFGVVANYLGLALFALSVVLTVLSGINYIVKNIEVLKK